MMEKKIDIPPKIRAKIYGMGYKTVDIEDNITMLKREIEDLKAGRRIRELERLIAEYERILQFMQKNQIEELLSKHIEY